MISADGNFIAFDSFASDLIPGTTTNGNRNEFLYNRAANSISLISTGPTGTGGSDWSEYPSISADGNFIAFYSQARDLIPCTTTNGNENIFLYERNREPTLNPIGNKTTNENQQLTFTISGSDPNTGDTLTYSATSLPTGAIFDPNTRTFTWTPTFGQAGTYPSVTFTVTDTDGLSTSETITIMVNHTNQADLRLQVFSNNPMPMVGRQFWYTVYLWNTGPENAIDVNVTDLLPTGLTYNSYMTSKGTFNGSVWNVETIQPGAFVYLVIRVTPTLSVRGQTLINTATAAFNGYDPTPAIATNNIIVY